MVGGLDISGVGPPPVLMGALGPHMLRLAGRLADGNDHGGGRVRAPSPSTSFRR